MVLYTLKFNELDAFEHYFAHDLLKSSTNGSSSVNELQTYHLTKQLKCGNADVHFGWCALIQTYT